MPGRFTLKMSFSFYAVRWGEKKTQLSLENFAKLCSTCLRREMFISLLFLINLACS